MNETQKNIIISIFNSYNMDRSKLEKVLIIIAVKLQQNRVTDTLHDMAHEACLHVEWEL
jgi:hypothetical protein